MATEVTRIEIGFDGGLIVAMRVPSPEWDKLEAALRAGEGHVDLASEDATYHVAVSKISYVKHERHVARVGF